MSNNLFSLRLQIRNFLLNEIKHYITNDGQIMQHPGHRDFTEDEPFSPNLKGLTKAKIDYFLDELPPELKSILYAPDVQILDEPDQPEGIFTVYSKSLDKFFQFAFGNEDHEDWTVFASGQ